MTLPPRIGRRTFVWNTGVSLGSMALASMMPRTQPLQAAIEAQQASGGVLGKPQFPPRAKMQRAQGRALHFPMGRFASRSNRGDSITPALISRVSPIGLHGDSSHEIRKSNGWMRAEIERYMAHAIGAKPRLTLCRSRPFSNAGNHWGCEMVIVVQYT